MDFEPGWAILAGLIGGAAMATILYMGIVMLPDQMRMNLFMMLGTISVRRIRRVEQPAAWAAAT